MLHLTPVPAFQDNYIWVLSAHSPALNCPVVAVDPGCAASLSQWLEDQGCQLHAILITHYHADHTGGVASLQAQWQCPVYGPDNSPFSGITQPLHQGDLIYLLETQFQIQAVPGHTLDHISYYSAEADLLLCGDTLFMAGCGRLFEGTAQQMQAAMDYFAQLPDQTRVACTHEYTLSNLAFAQAVEPENPEIQQTLKRCQALRAEGHPTLPSSIGLEKKINPFMRTREAAVQHAVALHAGREVEKADAILAQLREWKNAF